MRTVSRSELNRRELRVLLRELNRIEELLAQAPESALEEIWKEVAEIAARIAELNP